MEIKSSDPILISQGLKKDSIDIPDCFGEFNKENRLCAQYCSMSIKCCVLYNKNPKIDILEKLLIHNQYALKLQ